MVVQPHVEIGDTGGDVVADQPHTFDPVDPAFGGFVGVPDLEAGSGNVLHACFAPECDHDVNIADQLWVNQFGCLVVMSTPTSLSASADSVLTAAPGWVPAEYTCTASPAIRRISPAAIWDLPAFFTHTNNTEGLAAWLIDSRAG
jgi:hypothetical protein